MAKWDTNGYFPLEVLAFFDLIDSTVLILKVDVVLVDKEGKIIDTIIQGDKSSKRYLKVY